MKRFFIVNLFVVSLFLFTGCVAVQPKTEGPADVPRYTKFNIHGQEKTGGTVNASYANWTGPFTGHVVIPMNSKVTVKSKRRGFTLFVADTGQKINFQLDEKRMEMSTEEYIDLITSSQKVSMAPFSKIDRKGIKQGKVFKGMTKNGVMAAFGYPATHKTPSPKSSQWVYWNSRYGTKVVVFNKHGIVKALND